MLQSVAPRPQHQLIYRHSLVVRITHWVNVLCLTILLMSGLQIFNAHPALYFGQQSNFDKPVLSLAGQDSDAGLRGITTIAGHQFDTTGVLGASNVDGQLAPRGFPAWITLPSYQDLATGRVWHFFFAWLFLINGLVYLLFTVISRHLQRDLLPTPEGISHIGQEIKSHLLLRFPRSRHYNVIQQVTYLLIIFIVLPILVLAGWTMSPGLDALFQPLLDFFGGRQSARSIHFIAAFAVVLFVIVHIFMVIVSGLFNNLRSMITGRYDIGTKEQTNVS